MILKVLAFLFMIVGAVLVYAAGWLVKWFGLEKDVQLGFDHTMDAEELTKLKHTKSIVRVKLLGMLVMLLGLILVIIAFR